MDWVKQLSSYFHLEATDCVAAAGSSRGNTGAASEQRRMISSVALETQRSNETFRIAPSSYKGIV